MSGRFDSTSSSSRAGTAVISRSLWELGSIVQCREFGTWRRVATVHTGRGMVSTLRAHDINIV